MSHAPELERVWDIVEKTGVCMLTTRFAGGLRARPVEPRPDRAQGLLFVLTDVRSGKEHEIDAAHEIGLAFFNAHDKAYLSITAEAVVTDDRARAAAIWKSSDGMWWSGPQDPNLRVLRITPHTAELWDGPASSAVALFEFVKARLTGAKPNLGENRKKTVEME